MHADRTNRSVLVLLGVLLTAAGVAGACAGFGVFGSRTQHSGLLDNSVGRFFGTHGAWLWLVVAAVALVLALLALRWLVALLFSTDRMGDLAYRDPSEPGGTTLAPGALTDAVVAEIGGYRGVDSARARLIGVESAPVLVIAVGVEQRADGAALRHRIEDEAIAHARQALERPDLAVQLDLTVSRRGGSRVR